ncbi:hypothetical protein [Roseivivax sp.]
MQITLPPEGLYLHLGAHRTGTGSFQEFLASNEDAFADMGINLAVANRDGLSPGSLRLRLPDARHFRRGELEERAVLRDEALSEARVNRRARTLISEENIPGSFNAIFADAPYRAARERMGFLKAALARPVRRVVFVTRSYDSFYPSAYRKRCEFRKIAPFSDYAPRFLAAERGWPELIADIQAALASESLVVLRYEDRPDHAGLLRALMPELSQEGLTPLARRYNVSASDAACHAIQAGFAADPGQTARQVRALIRAHAEDRSAPPIAAFTPEEVGVLRERYSRDLEVVAAMPGVRLVTAPQPAAG